MTDTTRIDALLIEDDPADAGLVRHALRSLGGRFVLSHRPTLAEGLAWAAENPCEVVLLDLTLPDSAGFDTIRRVRQALPGLPVVVLTGHDDEEFAMAAVAAGTQDYLFKGATDGAGLQRAIRYAIARKHLEERLRQSEQRLQSIIALAQDAILSVDRAYRIVLFNPAAERLFGYAVADVLGRPLGILMPERFRRSHDRLVDAFARAEPSVGGMAERREVPALAKNGREFPIEVSISRDGQQDGVLFTAMIRDITERKRLEDELRVLATTDSLTGLPNRREFLAAAERELLRLRRYGRPVAVLMIDIDHFKRINDALGHAAGDRALRCVGKACRDLLRDCDLFGRLGGEEFAVLLPETDLPPALEVAQRLRAALAALAVTTAGGGTLHLTASIGVAACEPGDTGIEQALGRADRALYRAKAMGRNRVAADPPAPTLARWAAP